MKQGKQIGVQCIDYVNGVYYVLTKDGRHLISYNPEECTNQYIGEIENKNELYISSVHIDDKIFYLPYNPGCICEYDTKRSSITYWPFEFEDGEKAVGCSFGKAVGHNILIVSAKENMQLMRYDTRIHTLTRLSKWAKDYVDRYGETLMPNCSSNLCIDDEFVYLPTNKNGLILKQNTIKNEYDFLEIPTDRVIFNTVINHNNSLWLTGNSVGVFRWDYESNELHEYSQLPNGFRYDEKKTSWPGAFFSGIVSDGSIIYAPLNSNMYIKVNVDSGELDCFREIDRKDHCFIFSELTPGIIYSEESSTSMHNMKDAFLIKGNEQPIEFGIMIYEDILPRNSTLNERILVEDTVLELPQYLNLLKNI